MQIASLVRITATVLTIGTLALSSASAEQTARITGPYVHENLAAYFIHGQSAPGPVPLTLHEALANGNVQVIETGNVNQLNIENTGDVDVFIQSGDIVKGGQQDRVLTVSLLLPPKSGKVSIASYCVEQGRWSARGKEDVKKFASAFEAMPSREAKLAMSLPAAPAAEPAIDPSTHAAQSARGYSDTSKRQKEVWSSVAQVQSKLAGGLNAAVASTQSVTSLQLSLENEKLKQAREAYVKTLLTRGEAEEDIVGYVFAVNGKLNSGDVYPSNALFRKMWPKLLNASVTEAIGEKEGAGSEPPAIARVTKFLDEAENGKSQQQSIGTLMRQETRDADTALYVEAKRRDGYWVHRNYLAK
jgi:hypothetical protein